MIVPLLPQHHSVLSVGDQLKLLACWSEGVVNAAIYDHQHVAGEDAFAYHQPGTYVTAWQQQEVIAHIQILFAAFTRKCVSQTSQVQAYQNSCRQLPDQQSPSERMYW